MRLIDAENVAKNLTAMKESLGCNAIWIDTMIDGLLTKESTIDAEPVVRCEECVSHTCEEPGMVYCPSIIGGWVRNDFYCADGERDEVSECD